MKLCLRCNQYYNDVMETCPKDNSNLEPVGKDPLIGALINDRYVVDSVVGKGSSGIVYKAARLMMGGEVAVKVIHSYLGADGASLDRLLRELRAAEKLRHPHIITLWESGITDDGQPYLVMDYLEGITLSQMITQKGALPVPRVLNITRQVCEALTHAHDAGFIHRDMKPENIVLEENESRGDYAKVLDFGIADTPADSAARAKFGKPKTVAGSPAYMSPEQCQGFELDFRSDLYSVGVIVFEMFTGRRPFLAPDLVKLMYKTVTDPAPTMSQVRQDLIFPDKLEAVIAKALKKTPEERQLSLREFFAELEAACQGVEIKVKKNSAGDHVTASELEFEPSERLLDDKPAARPRFEAGPEEMAEFQMPPPPPPRGAQGAPPAPGAGAPPPPPKPVAPQALSARPLPSPAKPGAPAPGSPPPPPGGRPAPAGAPAATGAPPGPGGAKTPPPPPPGGRPAAPPGAVPGAPRPQAPQAGAPQPRPQQPGQPQPGQPQPGQPGQPGQPQQGQPRPAPAGGPQGAPQTRPPQPGAGQPGAGQPNPNGQPGRVDENSPPTKSQGKLSSLVKRPAGVGPAPTKPTTGTESASSDQMRGRDVRPPSVYSYVPPPEEVKKEAPPAGGPGPRPPQGQPGPGGPRPGGPGGAPGPGGPRPQGAPGQGPNKPGMRPQPGKPQSGPGSQGSGSPGSPANKPGPQQRPPVAGTKPGAQQPPQNRPGPAPGAAPLKGLSEDEVARASQDLFGEGDNNNRLKALDGHIPTEKDARALDKRRIGHLDWEDEIEALKTGSFEPISDKDLQPAQTQASQVNWPPGTPLSEQGHPAPPAQPAQPAQVPPQQQMPQQQMPPMMPPYQGQSWPPGSIPPGQIPYDQSMSYPPGMMQYMPPMGYPPGYMPPGQMMPPGYQYPPTGPDGQPLPMQPGYVYGYPGMPMMPPGMVPMQPGQQGYMQPGAMPPQMVPPGQQAPAQGPEGHLPQRPPGIVASPAEEDDYGDYEEEPSLTPSQEVAPEDIEEAKLEEPPVVEEVPSANPLDLPLDSPSGEFAEPETKPTMKSDSAAASKLSSLFGDPDDFEEDERKARREAAAAAGEAEPGGPKPGGNYVSPRKSLSALLALSASDSEVFSAGGGALSPRKEPAVEEIEESKPASGFGKLFDKGADEGAPKGGALGALLKAVQNEPESPYAPPKEPSLPTNPLNKGDDLLGGSDDLLGASSSGLNKIPLPTNEIADAVDKLFDDASGGGIGALLGGDESDDFSDASARFAKAMSDAEDDDIGGVRPHAGLHGGMDPDLESQFPPPAPQPPRANDFANASTSTSDALSRLLEAASKAPDRPLETEGVSDIDKMADRVNKPPARISKQLAALKSAEEESRASRTGMPPGMQDPSPAFPGFGAPRDDASGVRKSATGAYSQDAVNARIAELNKKLEQQSLGGMNAELPPAMAPDPSVIPDRREVVNRIMEEAASRSGNSGYGPGPASRSSSIPGLPAEGFSRSDLENINAQNLQSMAEAEARKGGSARGMKSRYGGRHIDWGKIIAAIAVVGVIGYVALNPSILTQITNLLPKNFSINFGAGGGTTQESQDAQLAAQVDDLAKQGQLSSAIKLLIDEEKKNGLSTELSDKLDTLYISLAQYYRNKGDNEKAGDALKNVPPESVKYKEAQNLLKQLSGSKKGSKKKKRRG